LVSDLLLLESRRAAADASIQFSSKLTHSSSAGPKGSVQRDGCVVEAFPNAFLAVLLPEEEMLGMPLLRRGEKFDWLYARVVSMGRLESVFAGRPELPEELRQFLREQIDHELRAALICLLTAAFAFFGTGAVVGDTSGGWFWLPPWSLWQEWAKIGLRRAATAMASKGFPVEACPND
jgi:hypothetical protein